MSLHFCQGLETCGRYICVDPQPLFAVTSIPHVTGLTLFVPLTFHTRRIRLSCAYPTLELCSLSCTPLRVLEDVDSCERSHAPFSSALLSRAYLNIPYHRMPPHKFVHPHSDPPRRHGRAQRGSTGSRASARCHGERAPR